ncbi:AcrR family transcriptional regulator [Cellulosimicrobium cellulans]|uniref:helix-turn-helix domain-containing protein n=1 Tax=Cellulosimicrobium cellulans TaxID=1710 RepID=UPI00195BDDB9|nr:helix-turn-helix domain-containing protein [Cellulosimicrobium cellulans]MBM7817572.1 AcrR family transcriptional regulator [Cellulosimicrobium cellulans]
MQETRRTNAERTFATRTALVAAARELFVDPGYAEASTPQIAAAAHVTRGALYHHYADKRDLFRAVVEAEAEAVAREIEARTGPPASVRETAAAGATRTAPRTSDAAPGPRSQRAPAPAPGAPDAPDARDARGMLVEGARAYLDAMAVPGRTRLLLVDAPAVLGAAEADALDARHARRTLRAGLAAALDTAPDQERTREDSARDHGTRGPTAGPRHAADPAPERPSPVPAREHGPTAPRVTDDVALDIAHDDRLDALTLLLSAAFDRAALALDGRAPPHPVRAAVTELVDRVCAPRTTR